MNRGAPAASTLRTIGWLGLYVVVVCTPLLLAGIEARPGGGLVHNLAIALGFVALSVLGVQFAITPRSTRLTVPFGLEAVVRHHRELTLLALVAAYGHPALLLTEDRTLLHVLHGPLRLQLAWGSVAALSVLVLVSLLRRALHLSYWVWQISHTLLAVVVVGAATAHAFLIDEYTRWLPLRLLWVGYAVLFFWLAVWVRLVRPMRLWQRPWRVVELWPEPGKGVTVSLEPAHRHGGQRFRFQAGQFAWLFTRPRSMPQDSHPFSISSSATSGRLEFTVKDSGSDFTGTIRGLRVGERVYLDGPHGTFTMERHPAPGYVFLATGVGVTPFLSMLATMADRLDGRPIWLFLGNRNESQIVGIRQLSRLAGRLNLTTVHVISQGGPDWAGERGRIDIRLLARNLPQNYRELHYFVCSRDDVVRSLRRTLHRGLDVPANHIHTELFELV
jgi:predicted ferric reductase